MDGLQFADEAMYSSSESDHSNVHHAGHSLAPAAAVPITPQHVAGVLAAGSTRPHLKADLIALVNNHFPIDGDFPHIHSTLVSVLQQRAYISIKDVSRLGHAFQRHDFRALSLADQKLREALMVQVCDGSQESKNYDRLADFFVAAYDAHAATLAATRSPAPNNPRVPSLAETTSALVNAVRTQMQADVFFKHVYEIYFGLSTPVALSRPDLVNKDGQVRCGWPGCEHSHWYTWHFPSKRSFERLFDHLRTHGSSSSTSSSSPGKRSASTTSPVRAPKRATDGQRTLQQTVAAHAASVSSRDNRVTQQQASTQQCL